MLRDEAHLHAMRANKGAASSDQASTSDPPSAPPAPPTAVEAQAVAPLVSTAEASFDSTSAASVPNLFASGSGTSSTSTGSAGDFSASPTGSMSYSLNENWLQNGFGAFSGLDLLQSAATTPLQGSSWLGELGVLATASPTYNSQSLPDGQQTLDQLFQDILGPEAFQTFPVPSGSPSGGGEALALPVPPDPPVQYPVQDALAEFWKTCAAVGAETEEQPQAATPDSLPSIYDCSRGTHVLELLPTSFIWLNAFKIVRLNSSSSHLPLLAGYANYMDSFFKKSHQVLCSAALVSGAAFIAVQRFDEDDSNEVKRSVGEAFLNATGIHLVDLSEAAVSINNQLGQIREKSTPSWDAFVSDPAVPVLSKLNCLYDIAMAEVILDGAAKCAARLDKIANLMSSVFPPSTSTINVSDLTGFSHQALGKWIGAEIFQTILRNRKSCVNFTCNTSFSDADDDPTMVCGVEWLFGCPDILMCTLAATSNLAVDIRSDPAAYTSSGILASHYAARAASLLNTLQSYNPRLRAHLRGPSLYNTARIAVQETWRQAALIHYHQTISRLPADDPVLQGCLVSLLDVYDVVEKGLPALLMGPVTVPLFLASSVALTPQHQYKLRLRHEIVGVYQGPRDCHRFIERLWRKSFTELGEGKQMDWHELAEVEKPLAYL
ncbi:hypothetical protein JCM8547_008319 [Rhodosporidiobolus lusitaniae]